jgi:regulator of sirC expression with transglutaminase-like and TPR domain
MFLKVTYTEPAVVKPLVEMAIKASSSKVWIGEGGGDYLMIEEFMKKAEYNTIIAELQKNLDHIVLNL